MMPKISPRGMPSRARNLTACTRRPITALLMYAVSGRGDDQRYVFSLMKIAVLLTTMLLLALSCSIQPTSDIPSPFDPDPEIEHKLRTILPKGWSLAAKENTFTLRREERVTLYVEVAWDVRRFQSFEEAVRHYGSLENYQIVLRFEPRLLAEEYEQLRVRRQPFERILNEGAHSKDEWGKGIEEFNKHKVPVYFTDRYSVFADKSDNYPVKIYPESVVPECKGVLASLDRLFQRYERSEGRNSDF